MMNIQQRIMDEKIADAASEPWERRVRALQRIVKIANSQLAPNYAPLTGFAWIAEDPSLLAEVEEALR